MPETVVVTAAAGFCALVALGLAIEGGSLVSWRNGDIVAATLLTAGIDLRREPWETRRATLASLLRPTLANLLRRASDGIRLCKHLDSTDGDVVFRHACAMGLKGIVAKRRDRPYHSGRSPDWIKMKTRTHRR